MCLSETQGRHNWVDDAVYRNDDTAAAHAVRACVRLRAGNDHFTTAMNCMSACAHELFNPTGLVQQSRQA
jgi:hypothetical protein